LEVPEVASKGVEIMRKNLLQIAMRMAIAMKWQGNANGKKSIMSSKVYTYTHYL
jgi:hypothetical protein